MAWSTYSELYGYPRSDSPRSQPISSKCPWSYSLGLTALQRRQHTSHEHRFAPSVRQPTQSLQQQVSHNQVNQQQQLVQLQSSQTTLRLNQQTLCQQQQLPQSLLSHPLTLILGQPLMEVGQSSSRCHCIQPTVALPTPLEIQSISNVATNGRLSLIPNADRAARILDTIYETHKRSAGTHTFLSLPLLYAIEI